MADGQVKYCLYFTYFEVNAYRCFGLALTFVKVAGTLNELYDVLIFSHAILISAQLCRVKAKESPFQDQCDILCIYSATSKGRKKNVITITM